LIVKVLFFTSLREITGKREELIELLEKDSITINLILLLLTKRFGKAFKNYVYSTKTNNVRGFLQFLINGKSIQPSTIFQAKLKDGDVLAILPPVGGG
jgi:MoaD family protein